MLATRSDADVERAIAAFGAPSMPYRTFRVEPPTPNAAAPSQSTAVAFPLLVAALPETAGVPAPSPPPQGAEAWPSPVATSLPAEPAAPIPADQEPAWRGTEARQAAHEQAVRSTPLASVFRLLRGEPIRRDKPPEPRPGLLQDVFRRL